LGKFTVFANRGRKKEKGKTRSNGWEREGGGGAQSSHGEPCRKVKTVKASHEGRGSEGMNSKEGARSFLVKRKGSVCVVFKRGGGLPRAVVLLGRERARPLPIAGTPSNTFWKGEGAYLRGESFCPRKTVSNSGGEGKKEKGRPRKPSIAEESEEASGEKERLAFH